MSTTSYLGGKPSCSRLGPRAMPCPHKMLLNRVYRSKSRVRVAIFPYLNTPACSCCRIVIPPLFQPLCWSGLRPGGDLCCLLHGLPMALGRAMSMAVINNCRRGWGNRSFRSGEHAIGAYSYRILRAILQVPIIFMCTRYQ